MPCPAPPLPTCPQQPLPHRGQVSKLLKGSNGDWVDSDPHVGALLDWIPEQAVCARLAHLHSCTGRMQLQDSVPAPQARPSIESSGSPTPSFDPQPTCSHRAGRSRV